MRKSCKGEESSSPRDSPSDPRNADQQLDDELRKAQRKAEAQMSEAAEQPDDGMCIVAVSHRQTGIR